MTHVVCATPSPKSTYLNSVYSRSKTFNYSPMLCSLVSQCVVLVNWLPKRGLAAPIRSNNTNRSCRRRNREEGMRNSLHILKTSPWQQASSHNNHTSEPLLWWRNTLTSISPSARYLCKAHKSHPTVCSVRYCLLYLCPSTQECLHLLMVSFTISPQLNIYQLTWRLVIM